MYHNKKADNANETSQNTQQNTQQAPAHRFIPRPSYPSNPATLIQIGILDENDTKD
jgi:hypothetical protein